MSETSTPLDHYGEIFCKNYFNGFTVYVPGVLQNGNILFIIEARIKEKLNKDFGTKICVGLKAIGVKVNGWDTVFVENMGNSEKIIEIINGFSNVKYFLMIGNNSTYNAVMKEIKYETNIRGNYKNQNKLKKDLDFFQMCLEINKQCRGVNYPCSKDFPEDTVFVHFILDDYLTFCGTNATKLQDSTVMIPLWAYDKSGKTDFIYLLEKICRKLTGEFKDKRVLFHQKNVKNFIVTFENHRIKEKVLSGEIETKMYETVAKWIAFANIAIAEIILKESFIADNNTIKSCEALKYDGGLDSKTVLKLLNLCKNCNDSSLKMDDETSLPEPVKLAVIHRSDVLHNYTNEISLWKEEIFDSDDEDDFVFPILNYPKIKHRNHVLITED